LFIVAISYICKIILTFVGGKQVRIITSNPEVIGQFSVKVGNDWLHSYLSNGFVEPDGSFVEREYQAAKAARDDDAAAILTCERPFGPSGAKKLGRSVELRSDWDQVKYQVMVSLVMAKFTDHPELAGELLATEDALLIEGNTWHDNIWGDCKCGRPDCLTPGLNWLGQILMCVREAFRQRL
jgi:ribA/ribD-fused uncharacterized protein